MFRYTVQSGENDSNGIAFSSTTISLNLGTMKDGAGNNADLTFTAPSVAYLPTARQLQSIRALLKNQQQGEFIEQGLYYHLVLRPLLPDELPQKTVAMLGSNELSYSGIPLHSGSVPKPKPTP